MTELLEFTPSPQLSFGIELELQVVNTTDYNLTQGASYLLRSGFSEELLICHVQVEAVYRLLKHYP